MPPDVRPLLNVDGAKSSQDSLLAESQSPNTPHKLPVVDLAGSPTSKRRVSSRHTPQQRQNRTPDYGANDTPVWVPSSAPTRLANGYRNRSGSPSNLLEMELSSNKRSVFDGQLAHGRVAALQSQGRAPVEYSAVLLGCMKCTRCEL